MSRHDGAGFTLIEVLVALVIVALGMAALLGTLTSAADSAVYLRDKTFATWIALNRITETRLANQQPDTGKTNGKIEYAGREWLWEQEVVNVDLPGARRIDVRVRPADVAVRKGKEASWYATASGVRSTAIAPPSGDFSAWDGTGGGTGTLDQNDGSQGNGSSDAGDQSNPSNFQPPRGGSTR